MTEAPQSYPETARLRHCKFCGQHVIDPCFDEMELTINRRTVNRCDEAAWAREAECHYEERVL